MNQIPNHIKKILPELFLKEFSIQPILDDRMFVVCAIYDASEKYNQQIKNLTGGKKEWIFKNEFYQYIFIDSPGSPGVANDEYQNELLDKHLYTRWLGVATLYGISRYSFVSYTTWDKIFTDTRTIYYKIAELCLLQRASVIKFTEEVRRISNMNENEIRLSAYISDLYKNYISFINGIYFRDITPQEQGIELYDMLRDKMRIEKEVTDLDKEINELHEYARLQEEKSNSNRLQLISILGGLFVVPSFIIGIFGIDNIPLKYPMLFIILMFITAAASLLISTFLVKRANIKAQKFILGISVTTWISILLVVIYMALVVLIFFKNT